jgi:PAS domain S-box-containing protein
VLAEPHGENKERLRVLNALAILDTPPEKSFDDLNALTAAICEVPICLISLVESNRQWFKSEIGLGIKQTPIEQSICAHAIALDEYLEVEDTHLDVRTADNPLCMGDKPFRFYAGALLRTSEGWPLGTLCVLDYKPRVLSPIQRQTLQVHADNIIKQLELRRALASEEAIIAELGSRKKNLRLIFNNVPSRIWLKDDKNRILQLNESAAESMNITVSDGEGADTYKLFPEMAKKYHDDDLEVIESGKARLGIIEEYTPIDGSAGWVSTDKIPYTDPQTGQKLVLVIATDITELKVLKEQALIEKQFKTFVGAAPDATLIIDVNGIITYVNKRAEDLFDYEREQLVGRAAADLLPENSWANLLADREEPTSSSDQRPAISGFESNGRIKDGTSIPVEINLSAVGTPERPLVSASIRDTSRRKSIEARSEKLQLELAHAARVTTMGQMATGLAHELNQPLTAIVQSTDAAMFEAKQGNNDPTEIIEILGELEAQALRAGDIIQEMRQFVKKDEGKSETFDLNDLIQQSVRLVKSSADKENIEIEIITGDLKPVTGMRVQLIQVLVNLIQNSIQAITGSENQGRKIIIKTINEDRCVMVIVEDTGPGIPRDLDLFAPFVTTNTAGMGMGLPICRSILQSHDSELKHDSAYEGGARFRFTLPVK